MSWLRRFWQWLTRRENSDGLTPLSEKARTEQQLAHLQLLVTEIEARWWATHDRKREDAS